MPDCNSCKAKQPENVPRYAHEIAMAMAERTVKRLWIVIILLIVFLVGSNCAWLWYESQFEDFYQEVTQEAETGTNNFVGGDVFGEADNKDPQKDS